MTYAMIAIGVGALLLVFALARDMGWALIIGILLIAGGVGAIFVGASREEREAWALFAAEHSCRVVGKQSGTTSIMVLPNATSGTTLIPITSPGKTGYACDDGVTYWR